MYNLLLQVMLTSLYKQLNLNPQSLVNEYLYLITDKLLLPSPHLEFWNKFESNLIDFCVKKHFISVDTNY